MGQEGNYLHERKQSSHYTRFTCNHSFQSVELREMIIASNAGMDGSVQIVLGDR
jgi:hypothetical protein